MSGPALMESKLARMDMDLGDLVEATREDTGATRRNFTQYRDDPVAFIRQVLKGAPWSRQVEIAEAVRDHQLVTARGGHSQGKDWLLGALLLWWVFARRGLAIAMAPTARQAEGIIGGEMRRHFHRGRLPGQLYQRALKTNDEHAAVLLMTSTDTSKLTGWHCPNGVLVVLSEAQGLEAHSYDAAFSLLADGQCRVLATGNPIVARGRFYATHREGSQWHRIRVDCHEHPNVVTGKAVIPGAVTRGMIENMKREWGEGSGQYRARVLGEFPQDNGSDGLLTREQLDAAVVRWREAMAAGVPPGPVDAALDVARSDDGDRTCLGFARGNLVLGLATWRTADTMQTVDKVLATCTAEDWPLCTPKQATSLRDLWAPREARYTRKLTVDAVGVGGGVVDRLRQMGYSVTAFNAATTPTGPGAERFANLRAQSYWRCREMLEQGRLALPPNEELMEEMLAQTWTVLPASGKIILQPKDLIKESLGRSCDLSDTVAMLVGSPPQGGTFTQGRARYA